MENLPPSLMEFGVWLGTVVGFGFIMSNFISKLTIYQRQTSDVKAIIAFILAIGLGFLSQALTVWVPGGIVPRPDQLYQVVVSAIGVWTASQVYYRNSIKPAVTANG